MLAFLLALSIFGHSNSWPGIYQETLKSVELMTVQTLAGKGSCTVTIVGVKDGQATALTAAHCVLVKTKPDVEHPFTIDKRIVWVSAVNEDLALIIFPATSKERPLALAFGDPTIGTPVAVIGHALASSTPSLKVGVVSNFADGYMWADAMVLGGDSGAPIVDQNHLLLGITEGDITDEQVGHLGYGVPVSAIRQFIANIP